MQIVYRNIRFSAKVDRCLRRRWRMHGDLSIRVREALKNVDLSDVELLEVDCSRVHAMQVGVSTLSGSSPMRWPGCEDAL